MYSLEYEMMIRVLHQLRSSGEFHADIPPQAALREGGRVVLFVQSGNIDSCFILNRNGQKLYYDAKARHLLSKLGTLDWKLASSTPTRDLKPLTPPVPAEKQGQHNPQRLMVSHDRIRAWSTLQRSVYFLADGTHTIEQMATLLSRSITTIEYIIHDFEVSGVITRS